MMAYQRGASTGWSISLNKEVCKRCKKEFEYKYHEREYIWDIDDVYWSRGLVFCPYLGNWHVVNNGPHDRCSYKLEHLVNE
jgi:hypothetical protein